MKRKANEEPLGPSKHSKTEPQHKHSKTEAPLFNSEDLKTPIHGYTPFTVSTRLPPLPEITQAHYQNAPFTHRSAVKYDRNAPASQQNLSYDQLEFMGDAYIELIASRLIYTRYGFLPVGRQNQLRELLVKNETLSEFSRAYGFEERVRISGLDLMTADVAQQKDEWEGHKGLLKVLGDVFEAYTAAVVMNDPEDGFAVAEKWLTGLWAPKLEDAMKDEPVYGVPEVTLTHSDYKVDPMKVYNPAAKAELQKRIYGGQETRLSYEPWRAPMELKGHHLGQNKHFIALYLTGYGYKKQLLGKGEGKNKVEAGNWAAMEAMHGKSKELVEECEAKLAVFKQERAEKKAREEAAKVGGSSKT